ncbi:hypothetical protein [Paenibacillus shenyangensis]|uniref:hypothetical protein n=1 Tax=Paenibacillus sp. A9 TaxID=1284352 RepID=UPI00036C7E35|nr:hypothetical protein [Paenibacillus sp. A9]
MIYKSGMDNGIAWSVTQVAGGSFEIKVGDKVAEYECQYPTYFGVDLMDIVGVNDILDRMYEEIQEG